MRTSSRRAYFYDIVVSKRAAHAHTPALIELAKVWQSSHKDTDSLLARNKGNINYRISDVQIDENQNLVKILISQADINTPDAAYTNIKSGIHRVVPKEEDEAGAFSAHLIISLKQEKNGPGVYMALLEGISGISHRIIQPLLNKLIKNACKNDKNTFLYNDPSGARHTDGAFKKHSFVPNVQMEGHISEDFVHDIEQGKVSSLVLKKRQNATNLDGDPFLKENEYSLKISVSREIPQQGKLRRLLSAMQSKKNEFNEGRITYKDRGDRSRQIVYDLDTGTPHEQAYIKSILIEGITPPLAQSSEIIVESLSRLMTDELVSERNVD